MKKILIGDDSKARHVLGWIPQYNLHLGLKKLSNIGSKCVE